MANQVWTLRPNATVTTVDWALVGAGTVHAALADNSDATYVQHTATADGWNGNMTYWHFDPTAVAPAANSQIRGAQLRVRAKQDAPSNLGLVLLDYHNEGLFNTPMPFNSGNVTFTADSTIHTVYSPYTAFPNYPISSFHLFGAQLGARVLTNQNTCYIFAAYLDIFYNAPPTVSAVTVDGMSGGVVQTLNPNPVVAWTYTDPENDPQERFRVVVKRATDSAEVPPVWDSGVRFSSLQSVAVPSGVLKNNTIYTVTVQASDVGSSGRFSAVSSATSFALTIAPVLMPHLQPSPYGAINGPGTPATGGLSYDPSTGRIASMVAKARPNLMFLADSEFADIVSPTARNPSIGAWTASAGTLVSDTTFPLQSISHAKITENGSGHCTMFSGFIPHGVVPGTVLTFICHVRARSAVRRNVSLAANFFTASSGTPFADSPLTVQKTTDTFNYKKIWLQCVVPAGAARAGMAIDITAGAGEIFDIDCCAVTPGCLNLLDNASFEYNDLSWDFTQTDGSGVTSASVVKDTTNSEYDVSDSALLLVHPGLLQFAKARTGINGIGLIFYGHLEGTQLMFSSLARRTAGTATQFWMGMETQANSPINYSAVSTGVTTAYQRFSRLADCSALADTLDLTPSIWTDSAGPSVSMHFDDVMVEPVWVLANGDFESGVNGNALPRTTKLGMTTGQLPQGWFDEAVTGNVNYDTTQTHGAALSLKMVGAAKVAQFFSVAGWNTIPLTFWKYTTAGAVTARVQQFDAGGIQVAEEGLSIPSGNGAWGQSLSAVTVHPEAAYAKLQLITSAGTTAWIDDVVVNVGATEVNEGSYWLDGGWSGAGFADWTGEDSILGVTRSEDLITWVNVRPYQGLALKTSPTTLAQYAMNDNAFTLTYDDYEWPLVPTDAPGQTFYYRALFWGEYYPGGFGYFVLAPPGRTRTVLPTPNPLRVSEWLLIDLLANANNLALKVKTVKVQTDETLQTYTPVGRSRRVVIGDVVLGEHIQLVVFGLTNHEWETIKALINQQSTLMLRSPDGYSWFVRVTKRSHERTWQGSYINPALRTVTLDFDEVDPLAL